MKAKIIIGIAVAVGISIGLFIANWANNEMKPSDSLTLITTTNAQDTLWQNILYGSIGIITMLGCVVMGWLISKKYYKEVKVGTQ